MGEVVLWVFGSLMGSLLVCIPLFFLGAILGLWVKAFVMGWKAGYEG
jgi:hypothetical protein